MSSARPSVHIIGQDLASDGQRPPRQARWLALPTRDRRHAERIRRVDNRLLYSRYTHYNVAAARMHRSRERVSVVRPFAPSSSEPLSRFGMPYDSSATSAPIGVRDGGIPCDECCYSSPHILAAQAALSSTSTRLVVFPRRLDKSFNDVAHQHLQYIIELDAKKNRNADRRMQGSRDVNDWLRQAGCSEGPTMEPPDVVAFAVSTSSGLTPDNVITNWKFNPTDITSYRLVQEPRLPLPFLNPDYREIGIANRELTNVTRYFVMIFGSQSTC